MGGPDGGASLPDEHDDVLRPQRMGLRGRLAGGAEIGVGNRGGEGARPPAARGCARARGREPVSPLAPAGSMVPMTSRANWLLAAVALPALGWVALSAVWLVMAALGVPRGFDSRTMTLTEASAVASHADPALLLRDRADPNAPSRLRAGLGMNGQTTMTPLEAATGAIRSGPVQMLVDRGARIDQRHYAVLWCGATARRNGDMLRFLESQRPNQPRIDCAKIRALW